MPGLAVSAHDRRRADSPSPSTWTTGVTTCVSTLQLMCRHAQKSAELVGHSGMVELSVSLPAEPKSKLRTSVDAPHRPSWLPGRPYVDSRADTPVIQSVRSEEHTSELQSLMRHS